MTANSGATVPDFNELVRSAPYKKGVADYHAGIWTEYTGPWDASVYESGRMVAAATGKKQPTIIDYFDCCEFKVFPPSLGGVAPVISSISTVSRLSAVPARRPIRPPDIKLFDW